MRLVTAAAGNDGSTSSIALAGGRSADDLLDRVDRDSHRTWAGWAALIGPVAAGAAVLTVRRHVLVAVALMTVAVLCVPPAEQILPPTGSPWIDSLTLTPFIALALVFCTLGSAPAAAAVAAVDGRLGRDLPVGLGFRCQLSADRGSAGGWSAGCSGHAARWPRICGSGRPS